MSIRWNLNYVCIISDLCISLLQCSTHHNTPSPSLLTGYDNNGLANPQMIVDELTALGSAHARIAFCLEQLHLSPPTLEHWYRVLDHLKASKSYFQQATGPPMHLPLDAHTAPQLAVVENRLISLSAMLRAEGERRVSGGGTQQREGSASSGEGRGVERGRVSLVSGEVPLDEGKKTSRYMKRKQPKNKDSK
jgi:hypothetical protein